MVNTLGHRETEKALQLGLLYSVDEALKINLIDEIAIDDKDLLARAEKQMLHWSRIPSNS
jgi:3,2-trans-enoyl-CoA isomerase